MLQGVASYLSSKIYLIENRCLSYIKPEKRNPITFQFARLLGNMVVYQALHKCGHDGKIINSITREICELVGDVSFDKNYKINLGGDFGGFNEKTIKSSIFSDIETNIDRFLEYGGNFARTDRLMLVCELEFELKTIRSRLKRGIPK